MLQVSIFSHTSASFAETIYSLLGKGRRQAGMIYAEFFKKGCFSKESWKEKQSLPLVEEILSLTDFSLPEMSLKKEEGGTAKFLLKYQDGLESESVAIPMEAGCTLCLSSQVGCRMGCAFCETGKMGLLRHLLAKEIIAQVFYAKFKLQLRVRNIVFMGMGEPLDNFEEVMQAIRILTDPCGFGLGPSRITVSTSGDADAIYRFMQEADPAVNLAVSVNASNDRVRDRLMPVNKRWNMQKLKEAMLFYCAHPRRRIFAEYVLLKGVNDSLEHADELSEYLRELKVKVNLIPYNPQSRDVFEPPEREAVEAFMQRMRENGYQALLRHSKGQKIMAACGQLGNRSLRKEMLKSGSLPLV